MKKVEIIPKPNEQLEEETISKSKKDEKNPPFKCSPFCALKKKNKSILKTCIPHMFSVSVKVRSVSVQTSSQCLKCPPCLKDILEKSKENDELKDISPKTSVEKPHASFEDNKSIASSTKETDSRRVVPEVKNEEFSEKSSLVELLPDSNEVEEKENIADELKAPTSDTNLSTTKALESKGGSEISLCEDCPPCSRGAQKLAKQTSGESGSISTQTSLSLLSNNPPYDVKTQPDDINYKMTKKSSREDSNLSVQINDNISARSKPSRTESNISKQMNDEMSRRSNPSDSHISMQPKDIDMNKKDISEKHDGRISQRSSHVSFIKAYSGLDESLNEKLSGKLDTSIVEKNGAVKTISGTSSCEDCPPCFPEVKIAERKYSGEWERTAMANRQFSPDDGEIGAEESSTSMVIETYANSEKDKKGRRKIGTIAISVRVNYPPCSNDVNNNIPQKTSDQLKNIFSEIGELIAEPNTSKIETEERRNQENTGDKKDISCIQYTRIPDMAEDRQDELSGKLQSISEEVMHTEMVSTNGDSEGEFSPASSIFETKIKKTSIELKYMASSTKKLSRIISSNEDVLQIRRSANRKNSPGNDFQPKGEFNINRTGRVLGKSGSLSSKIDTSITMNNNPYNQFKEERTLMNTKYSSIYYLTNKENFIPRKLSNKSHNSSAEVIEPVLMDNNSNSELNEVTSEMLNEEIKRILNSKTRKSFQHESNNEIIKLRKLSTKSRSSSSEIRSSSLRLKSSDSLFEGKKGTPSYQDKIKTRRLSNKSQGSTAEIKTPTTLNNTQRDKSKEENVKITADRNISRSESTDYRSKGEIIKARELSRKLQASTSNVETPTTLNNDPHDKSKEEQVEITTDRNIEQSESMNYKSKGKNIKARKSSNESRSMSAEIDATKPTEKIWGSKTNKDQAEISNGIENSTAHDQLNEVKGTTRRVSSELRNMSENVNTALATEKIDNLDEKSKHSFPADELVSREAIRYDENTSDKLKLDSTEAVTPVSPKINSNDQLRNLETEIPTIEKERYSIVSEASHAHEVEDVQDNIATNIQESSSQDFRLVSQTKLDETKIQSASSVGRQSHSVDRDDIEEQRSYINKEINSPKTSNLLDHEQMEKNEIQKSDMEKTDNPPCINCKPFSTDIKIIVKQIPGKQKSISSEFSESLPEVMQNVDSKRSGNLICVDCPPCSDLVKALPYQYPNESNDLFSEPTIVRSSTKQERNMSKKPANVIQSTSKETNGSTSANDHGVIINNKKPSIIDSPAYLNEQKIKGKQSVDHTSLSVNFSLGAKSNGDETQKEKHSENSLSADYLPISEQSKAMPEKVSETNTESTGSLPSDISTIGQFQEKKFNKVACIDCPACSHIIENVPKTSPDEQSPDSSKSSGLLPFSSSGQSHGYDTEKLNTDSNENSFCVDCPPCLNEAENVSRYSAGLSSELFSESQFSNIVESIQAKHKQKHSLRTETSRSVSSEEYSQDESVVIPKQESQPSRNISEVTNNDSFSPSNSGKQEVINQKSIGNLFADLPHQDERNIIEKNRSKASTDYDTETSEDSFCINCPPCSNEVEIPKFMSNGSSNVRSKSSEAESYLKKKILSKSPNISDATSSTTNEKEAAGKRSEVPPIGDYLAPSDAMLVTIKPKTESKGIEIDIMKTYNEKNSKSDVHSCRSNEVKKLVISIIDSCTSKMFPSEATSVAVVLDSKTNGRDVDEENVMSNECIDFYLNLITERFKKKAMDVDDDEFERMFEELTRELNTLFCECGKINPDIFEKSLSYLQSDEDKKGNEETATNYIKEENLKQMFNEMKIYLEDKLCSCKSKDINALTANAESRTSKPEALPTETEGRENETMKNKIDVEIDVQLNKPPQNISKEKIAQSNLFNDHGETEANKNDDDEPIDNENSDEQEISKSRDEILQNQQEVTESEDMILKSQRGSSIINENVTTLSQTLNDEIGDGNKLRTNSETDHSEDGAMKEGRGIASRNSGISDQDSLERFTKKETFESQAQRSITTEDAVKDTIFERKDGDSMKHLNYSMDEDVMKNGDESNRAKENENFETVDKKETFITNAKPSVSHQKTSDTAIGTTRSIDTQETNYTVNSKTSADQKIHKNIHIDEDLPENNSSTEQVSNDTRKFNTNILPIVFYDKMKIAVDKKKSDNDRKNEPPQTVSFSKFRSHGYQKEKLEGQKTAIANRNDDVRGLERLQWKDDDDDFHSATTCSEVYEHEETYLTLFDKVAMNPMTISDLFPRQLQLADQSRNSSNQESFFTAECPYFYEVSKFSTVYAQRMIPPPDQNNCCLGKQVESYEYTAKSSTYQDGRIFRIEPDGRELAEVAIKREREDPNENVDKIKVRIRLTDERNSKKPKPSVASTRTGTDMTIDRSQKFSRSSADFNVKYKAIKEKIVDETKVITEGNKIKILIPLDSTNFQNENN